MDSYYETVLYKSSDEQKCFDFSEPKDKFYTKKKCFVLDTYRACVYLISCKNTPVSCSVSKSLFILKKIK